MGMITGVDDGFTYSESRRDARNKRKFGMKYITWHRAGINARHQFGYLNHHPIYQWLLDSCQGDYVFGNQSVTTSGHTVLFELKEDVTMFMLRWG